MLSSKLYFRLLTLFAALLGIAQLGWGLYFLTPAEKQRAEPRPKYLVIREFAAPKFKYQHREPTEDGLDAVWRGEEIPAETGRKILKLLRGSKTWSATMDEDFLKHPEAQNRHRHFYPEFLGRLDVYENGSDMPSLSIDFLQSRMIMVTRTKGISDTYFIRPEGWAELDARIAAICEDPALPDAP